MAKEEEFKRVPTLRETEQRGLGAGIASLMAMGDDLDTAPPVPGQTVKVNSTVDVDQAVARATTKLGDDVRGYE